MNTIYLEEKTMSLSKKTALKTEKNCYELEITLDAATFGAAVASVY